MKTIVAKSFGSSDVLDLIEQPDPAPQPGQVLIRVHSAGVNFGDTVIRAGRAPGVPVAPPYIPGCEVAGVIEAIGEQVQGFSIGDRVIAPLFLTGGLTGGYAQLAAAPAAAVFALPDAISFDVGTALAMQGLTALLLARHRPVSGRTVLVTAAAGGVGSQLVQIAAALGAAQVIGVAGGRDKLAFLQTLGVTAIDRQAADWTEQVLAATGGRGPDIIFDAVGASIRPQLLGLLAPLGHFTFYGASEGDLGSIGGDVLGGLIGKAQTIGGFSMWPQLGDLGFIPEAYAALFALVESGALKVRIGGRFALSDAAKAHQALEARQTIGKLVLAGS